MVLLSMARFDPDYDYPESYRRKVGSRDYVPEVEEEIYFSVSVKSSGPIAGTHSMLALGACVVGKHEESFYVELKPISDAADDFAVKASGLYFEDLKKTGADPRSAITDFNEWVISRSIVKEKRPIFVAYAACYDWQFYNWCSRTYSSSKPFGVSGIDIKSYYMALAGVVRTGSGYTQLPTEFKPDWPRTGKASDDARSHASIFEKLMKESQARAAHRASAQPSSGQG